MSNPYTPPASKVDAPSPAYGGNETMASIIPFRNPPALIGYYLGVFSLIPFLGLLCAIPAIVLGILGLKRRKADPRVKGLAHALVALILGSLFTLVWGGAIVALIVSANR